MGKKEDRHRKLIQVIKAQGMLPARTLAEVLSVSEMTIRRDFEELRSLHHLEPVAERQPEMKAYDLLAALQKSNEQKQKIGKMAASLIKPNDVIIIDTGSTSARMLPYLPENDNLTVLCFNTNVLLELRYKEGIQPLFCGGFYHRNTEMFECPESIQFISRMRANKVFLSAAGVHKELGVTCANEYEVPTKHAVMQSSMERILLADSSKFDLVKPSYFCDLSEIHAVITDKGLPGEWAGYLREKGITLYLV